MASAWGDSWGAFWGIAWEIQAVVGDPVIDDRDINVYRKTSDINIYTKTNATFNLYKGGLDT